MFYISKQLFTVLGMYVCVYACMYVCVFVMYVFLYVCKCVSMLIIVITIRADTSGGRNKIVLSSM